MIKGIIFDLGEVILKDETKMVFRKHSHEFKDRLAVKAMMEQYYHGSHRGHFDNIRDFFEKTKPSVGLTVEEINELLEEAHSTKRLDEDMIQLILSLKKNYSVSLLTNFSSELNRFINDMFKISHLFDVIVNSYDVKIAKPDEKIYLHILDKLNLKPDECVFIDDKLENVEAARRLGIKGIVHTSFEQTKKELDQILS